MTSFGVHLLAETDPITKEINTFLDVTTFLMESIKYIPLIAIGIFLLLAFLAKKNGWTVKDSEETKNQTYAAGDVDDEEEKEDPWAWKREYDRRRRYEAQREARREERRKSRYDDYGYDEERETHYGEEHDVDENGYCHDCDCEEDDLI